MEYCDNELYHYGVKGMKWGRRMARGHGGPGVYATRKRQLAGDKRDLDALNKGEHLSYGVTKKRQAAYDARDRKALEKRISKNEKYLADKERKIEKNIAKVDKYRNKLAKKATQKSENFYDKYQTNKFNQLDLSRNGSKSGAYRSWKESEDFWREWEHDKSKGDYRDSSDKAWNDFFDAIGSGTKVKELIEQNKIEATENIRKAKEWRAKNKRLMNMTVDELTTKKDVKNIYKR